MSLFKRHPQNEEQDTDDEHDDTIDPQLRLRTVRTAASTIAESIRSEQRAERRRSRQAMRKKRSFFRGRSQNAKKSAIAQDSAGAAETGSVISRASTAKTIAAEIPGQRRNIYVNMPLTASELDQDNQPIVRYPRNKVRTTSMCILNRIVRTSHSNAMDHRIYCNHVYS
jgi:phospholipid-translocating ATPase